MEKAKLLAARRYTYDGLHTTCVEIYWWKHLSRDTTVLSHRNTTELATFLIRWKTQIENGQPRSLSDRRANHSWENIPTTQEVP